MQHAYQHSTTFAKLKSIKETIGTNLSSYQYLSSLDVLLYKTLYPVIDNTKFVDHFLAKILAWQYLNPRRKASSVDRSDFASYITLFLITPDTDKKLTLLKRTKLDRGVLAEMVRLWLKVVEPYETLMNSPESVGTNEAGLEQERLIETQASLKSDHSLYGAYQQVKYWWAQYQEFKNMILEKYTRMCLMKAQQDYVAFQHRVAIDDVIQVYLMNAWKAIDKCDTEKGVLTTHIQNWLKHARNQVMTSQLSDTAFVLPKNSKTVFRHLADANSVSLDDLEPHEEASNPEDDEERDAQIEMVRRIAKVFDPRGVGRLTLGIQEVLSTEDKRVLHALAIRSMSGLGSQPDQTVKL